MLETLVRNWWLVSLRGLVALVLGIILIIVVIGITLSIFFNAPNYGELLKGVISQGIKMVMGGIHQASMSLTTIG